MGTFNVPVSPKRFQSMGNSCRKTRGDSLAQGKTEAITTSTKLFSDTYKSIIYTEKSQTLSKQSSYIIVTIVNTLI